MAKDVELGRLDGDFDQRMKDVELRTRETDEGVEALAQGRASCGDSLAELARTSRHVPGVARTGGISDTADGEDEQLEC